MSHTMSGIGPNAFDARFGGAIVWIADIEAAINGGTVPTGGDAWAGLPFASEPTAIAPAGGVETIRISDLGWKSSQSDLGGVVPYPPLLISGPAIERRVSLSPFASDTYAWGSLGISRPQGIPNSSLAGRDTALRRVRIRAGVRGYDTSRGYTTDPGTSYLLDVFTGLAMTWRATEQGAELPIRDPSAWLNATIGTRKFLGTGGSEGPVELAGTPWPLVRGGSATDPVRSCPVVLVNAATRVYRWTDVGTVTTLYEDGAAVYTNAGIVADVFSSSASPGTFIQDTLGQIKLGSAPQGNITVDGYSGTAIIVATVLRNLLVDTAALPAGLLDEDSFVDTATLVNYAGGWAWTGQETVNEAIQPLLAAMGARLIASRSGGLRLWPLRAPPGSAVVTAAFDKNNAVSVVPIELSAPLSPPAASWTVGYQRTHTTTTSLNPTVSAAERERLSKEYRTAFWSDTDNLTRYAQPSRPETVPTALLRNSEATSLVQEYGSLWGVPRTLWQVTVPTGAALLREIGDVVSLTWPIDGLSTSVLGQVVGDSIRAGDPTANLLILV